jgi:hypothetical protein
MDRAARARLIAANNACAAAERRARAMSAAPAFRRTLLLDAARLEHLAAAWRAEAIAEEEKAEAAAPPGIPALRRTCWCGRALSTLPDSDGTGCSEHDGILTPAAVTA